MILREALDVVLERIDSRGGEDPDLAHGSAQHLANAARPLDEIPAADEHRSRRRSQPLRQTHRHRVEARAQILHRHAELDRGIENARAVEVNGKVAPARKRDCIG